MSNQSNDNLLDSAQEMLSAWEGTLHEELIRQAVHDGDMEALAVHVKNARDQLFYQEYEPKIRDLSEDEIQALASDSWSGVPF